MGIENYYFIIIFPQGQVGLAAWRRPSSRWRPRQPPISPMPRAGPESTVLQCNNNDDIQCELIYTLNTLFFQDELDETICVWDSHVTRPSKNDRIPSGQPRVMYMFPELYTTHIHYTFLRWTELMCSCVGVTAHFDHQCHATQTSTTSATF